jgi:hypothetical protein
MYLRSNFAIMMLRLGVLAYADSLAMRFHSLPSFSWQYCSRDKFNFFS